MFNKKKLPLFFVLSNKEEQAMKVLWNSQIPLSAMEIVEKIPGRTWSASSIQAILRSLEKKQAVEVAEITKLGKGYGRLFRSTISANEYATMQFNRYYQYNNEDNMFLISALLDKVEDEEKLADTLQTLLDRYRGK